MTTLHMGDPRIALSDLDPPLREAVRQVEALQRGATPPAWEHREGHRVLVVSEGLRFVPDEEDAKAGMFGQIAGGIAAVFGLALLGIVFEGKQAEPWMRLVAPLLLLVGGYAVWSGTHENRKARARPRTTGAYLFHDLLLHVSTFGCRILPRDRTRGFDYRTRGNEGAHTLFVRFVDDEGTEREEVLFYRNAIPTLEAWRTS